MKDLRIRKVDDDESKYASKLGALRSNIDVLDQALLETLSERMGVAQQIGQLKKERNVAVLQSNRWNEILGKMILEGEQKRIKRRICIENVQGNPSRID